MSDPSDRPGFILPGMPWFSEIEAESRLITRKRQVGRQAAQIEPEASNDNKIRVSIPAGVRQPLGSDFVFT